MSRPICRLIARAWERPEMRVHLIAANKTGVARHVQSAIWPPNTTGATGRRLQIEEAINGLLEERES